MKITITKIQEINKNMVINFDSSLGSGFATWVNSVKPVNNHQYDVELDIEKTISEKLITDICDNQHTLSINGATMIMNAIVESIESDGMAYLRLSPDCLIMIEIGDSNVSEGDRITLKLNHSDIEATAQGI